LGELGTNNLAMQRFAKLKQHITYKKQFPLEQLFISLSDHDDAQDAAIFTQIFSNEILPAYCPTNEIRDGMKETFLNIGCIYVLDKESGVVVCIIDPSKHTLETMVMKIMYNIGR
jgi:hypothetical protein